MRTGGWRCGGPGRATGDTASVYTSAGDCREGVSSAGGVKSISSSKWSSNSYVSKRRPLKEALHETAVGTCELYSSDAAVCAELWQDSHLEVDLPLLAAGHTVH